MATDLAQVSLSFRSNVIVEQRGISALVAGRGLIVIQTNATSGTRCLCDTLWHV